MTRYAAFLRGVSPVNAAMPDLKRAFEAAGFTEVTTMLSSGNVVFTAPRATPASLERRAEAAMTKRLGHSFLTLVRPMDLLRELLASDPYLGFRIVAQATRAASRVQGALTRFRGATGAAADTLARVQAIAGKLLTEPVRYGKPGLQAHITYLNGMTNGADQKIGRDAIARYEVLKREFDAIAAELAGVLGAP